MKYSESTMYNIPSGWLVIKGATTSQCLHKNGLAYCMCLYIIGWLYDHYGSYNVAFHVAGVPVIMGAITLLFIPWAQRTAVSTNVMQAVCSGYNTNLYHETTMETSGTRTEPQEDISWSLYTIPSEGSNKSDEPMLKHTLQSARSETDKAKKPYLVVDITDAVRQKVQEAMEAYDNSHGHIEEIVDGPLSQLGTPVFQIGSHQDRHRRSHSGTPQQQHQHQPIAVKLVMSPNIIDSSSVPTGIHPSFRCNQGGNIPSTSSHHQHSASSSKLTSVTGSIKELRRRMTHTSYQVICIIY